MKNPVLTGSSCERRGRLFHNKRTLTFLVVLGRLPFFWAAEVMQSKTKGKANGEQDVFFSMYTPRGDQAKQPGTPNGAHAIRGYQAADFTGWYTGCRAAAGRVASGRSAGGETMRSIKRRVRNAVTLRTQCLPNLLAAKFGVGYFILAQTAALFNPGGGYGYS